MDFFDVRRIYITLQQPGDRPEDGFPGIVFKKRPGGLEIVGVRHRTALLFQ